MTAKSICRRGRAVSPSLAFLHADRTDNKGNAAIRPCGVLKGGGVDPGLAKGRFLVVLPGKPGSALVDWQGKLLWTLLMTI